MLALTMFSQFLEVVDRDTENLSVETHKPIPIGVVHVRHRAFAIMKGGGRGCEDEALI
jgi:hypothetical protein